ncbi:MAG TPA: sigma-70 family RNA polymerase sigma factor [Pseudonocardiaceae bacterium]|nr:sigma-70 family RNA polymerase sigma factor [Pseudonocardiaceae bacterium]
MTVSSSDISPSEPFVWDDVFHQYASLVSATVRSFQLQDADAHDAVQATWLRLVENVHRVRFPERLGGWLTTTARNECLRICRQASPPPQECVPVPDDVADQSIGPEQRVVDAHTAQLLWDIVAELPPRQRAVVRELFTDDPRSYTDLAQVAGMPVGGIGPTRARALRQLREMLDGDGLGAASWR